MALIKNVADLTPEAIAAARKLAMNTIAKNPDLLNITNILGKDVAEELLPVIAISRGKVTPQQIKGLAQLRSEGGAEFPDIAKDLMNKRLGNVSSIRTSFDEYPGMPEGKVVFDEFGNVTVDPRDVATFTKLIKEMSANSLASRGIDSPFTAYRSFDSLFGYTPATKGVLSYTETPLTMASRWRGGEKMTWQPTSISPTDVTFDYGIGRGLRGEETEIQSLAKLVKPIGPRISLGEYVYKGGKK